eukprot:Pompholyxophrys_punicea_v1_NODE_82_length_3700_cov_3.100110.p1 type:complete len:179 gc:universal NODE_82_length_3700_cov_3.100110:2864-2328(-)
MLNFECLQFNGKFEVPKIITMLVAHILTGTVLGNEAQLTISQILMFNISRTSRKLQRHSIAREPPLPVGIKVYTLFRSQQLIQFLYNLGLSVSYDRVQEIVDSVAEGVAALAQKENVVCPSNLQEGLFTVCGYDNVDHNPSSTTSKGLFMTQSCKIAQTVPSNNILAVLVTPMKRKTP